MTLLSLIVVVLLERLVQVTETFHYRHYFNWYQDKVQSVLKKSESVSAEVFLLIWLAIPAVSVAVVQLLLGTGVLGLLFSIFILFLCYGCPQHRVCYKQYLEAACRGDQEACYLYGEKLGQKFNKGSKETLGQTLVWINFRHYFAVIFWFVVLGAAGAVFYVFSRNLAKQSLQKDNLRWLARPSNRLLAILVWLPARITGFAFLFVGHFSRALPTWLNGLTRCDLDARTYITDIADKAEDVSCPEHDYLTEPCVLLKLAKRAFLFLLSIIAIFTITGIL
ncbi:beta-lactamase regulator AmpE [Catenovulum sediminis]|uniref:Beta-lactamase regulator AmpE n=1 Tax=Catenovulum sediminis TaxID=1740262 RepID=A0ABV1RJT8_9ALTE|nr:beta-lactamase regulator AmpE [Catenovulum sediminis]